MNEKLKNLYKEVILKNNNEPINFIKRESAEHNLEAYNQLCGDRFKVFFDVENDTISKLSFHGFGCAISKASTSVLVQHLEGKSIEAAKNKIADFLSTVNENEQMPDHITPDFEAFSAARSFPGRLKCATLAWDELDDFFNKKKA